MVAGEALRPGSGQLLQRPLAVLQVAIGVVLLVNITSLAGSFLRFVRNDLGYEPTDVLTARLGLSSPPDQRSLDAGSAAAHFRPVMQAAEDRLLALPGVGQAGFASFLPLRSPSFRLPFEIRGQPPEREREPRRAARVQLVTPGYFPAMGMRLVEGAFPTAGSGRADGWTVVNETFGRLFLDDGDRLGRALRFRGGSWFEIVGVAADVLQTGTADSVEAEAYISYLAGENAPFFSWVPYAVLKTQADPSEVVARLRGSLRELDSGLVIDDVATMEGRLATAVALPRLFIFLLSILSATALGISVVGVYGLVYHDVARRRREIGIRMALGALPAVVLRSIVTRGLWVLVAGTVAGLVGAVGSHRLVAHLVIGTNPPVAVAYVIAPVLVGCVSLCACWVAARTVTRIDPLQVIRESAGRR